MNRPLHAIAAEIRQDWKNINYAAVPYVEAMEGLNKVTDPYGDETGSDIVAYFLSNANTWRGETAKRVKIELKKLNNYTK